VFEVRGDHGCWNGGLFFCEIALVAGRRRISWICVLQENDARFNEWDMGRIMVGKQ
jgi:hypothetical protein